MRNSIFTNRIKLTDEEILNGLKNNDTYIVEYFYKTVKQLINKFVRKNKGTSEDARDLCHDVVIIFYRQLTKENLVLRYSYTTYIYVLARNIWLKQLKIQMKELKETYNFDLLESDQSLKEFDESFVTYLKNKMFWKHFAKLKEDCKTLLLLTFQNIPDQEIARIVGTENKTDIIRRKSRCKYYLIESVRKDPMFHQVFDYKD